MPGVAVTVGVGKSAVKVPFLNGDSSTLKPTFFGSNTRLPTIKALLRLAGGLSSSHSFATEPLWRYGAVALRATEIVLSEDDRVQLEMIPVRGPTQRSPS
jgi:hypothetical protein